MIRIWIFLNTNKNVSRFSWFLCFLFFKYYLATLQVYSKQNDAILFQQAQALLRIHLILIRLRILDPHWKTMDPDPGHEHFLKIYWFFFLSRIVYIIFLLFMLKLDEPFRDQEFFFSFWFIFCRLDPDPWIRIFLPNRIRIQEAKILRIQRIRMISTASREPLCFLFIFLISCKSLLYPSNLQDMILWL